MMRDNDIKAPDGYTLGGLRFVRNDGTILFNRGWWQAPLGWRGEKVWVHEEWKLTMDLSGEIMVLEAAPPGMHIYEAQYRGKAVVCERTDRPDARIRQRRVA